ncbi:MAG: polysaccharide pyruvyl transferase CsaB [Synergistes sp.]|nr:polysaccharide pyruvyl transferase CsaB [Synergistes sp.]
MKKVFDVLLTGYYGFGNFGDELLAEASKEILVRCGTDPDRIALLSADPAESERKFGVKAFDRWKLSEVIKACRQSRILLLGGGGLFQDSTSLRSCVYYWAVILIARICGMTVFAAGQSVGPLRSRLAFIITRHALSLCSKISVRDEPSMKLIEKLGLKAEMTPDLALAAVIPALSASGCPTVLFNARPHYAALAEDAARKCREYAEKEGCLITGVALADEDAAEMKRLEAEGHIKFREIFTLRSLEDFAAEAASAYAAVGMRLHFVEMCLLFSLPVAACAYDPKVSGLCLRYNIMMLNEKPGIGTLCSRSLPVGTQEEILEKFRAALSDIAGKADGRR